MHHVQAKAPQLTWAGRGVGDGGGDGDDGCKCRTWHNRVLGGMRLAWVPPYTVDVTVRVRPLEEKMSTN
jgi:hypothetical protein